MDRSNDIYVHYGSEHYDKSLFTEIKNRAGWIKPFGGLWGAVGDSWLDWCKGTNFQTAHGVKGHFKFRVEGRVLRIHKLKDCRLLKYYSQKENPWLSEINLNPFCLVQGIDFEKMKKNYNAIEVYAGRNYELYQALYGWDVDSILVLNPNAVVEVVDND